MTLPEPECPMGYPWTQLQRELSEAQQASLAEYLSGQTGYICNGLRVDSDGRQARTACYESPHGMVTFKGDVERWASGLPVID